MGSPVLETVLNATLQRSRKKLLFAAVKSNAFYAYAMSKDMVEYEDGGKDITNPIITGRNPNVTAYSYYDELPVQQSNEFDTVKYGWSRVAGTVIISDQEQDENKGSTEIFKLIKGKMETLEETISEQFSTWLYGTGANKDPNGLALLVSDNPTTGTVGGIDRATNDWWRTMATDYNGSLTINNIQEALDDVLLDMKQGKNGKPDLILCGKNFYRLYRNAVRNKVSILADGNLNAQKMYDLGFDGVAFGGVTMIYDEACPADKAYILNTTYLRMHVLKHANMKVKELVAPWNTDAIGRRIIWQGQMCLWKANRTQAVIKM